MDLLVNFFKIGYIFFFLVILVVFFNDFFTEEVRAADRPEALV